jgi:nucleoid DNA-binding protein
MVEAFFEIVNEALVQGNDVKLSASATSRSAARRRGPGAIRAPASRSPSRPATW